MKAEHATPEMAKLIFEVTEAQRKDDVIIEKWQQNREKARKNWLLLSEEERGERTRLGLGFEENVPPPVSKWVRNIRRKIRYRLFRIREGKKEFDKGLKKWMELQFSEGMTWANFTFIWDVSSTDPLKVISPFEWDGQMIMDPSTKKKMCDPSAFTNQEM